LFFRREGKKETSKCKSKGFKGKVRGLVFVRVFWGGGGVAV